MDLGIAGRKAVVCASSRGLGLACAKALAQAGCDVVINGRDQSRLTAVAAELVRIDLAYRGKRGLPIRADQYLTPFPELARDQELLRALIEEAAVMSGADVIRALGKRGVYAAGAHAFFERCGTISERRIL